MGIAEPGALWGSGSLGGAEFRSAAAVCFQPAVPQGAAWARGGRAREAGAVGWGPNQQHLAAAQGVTDPHEPAAMPGPGTWRPILVGAGKKGRTWEKKERSAFAVVAKNV